MSYGICKECGTEKQMHYEKFCPKCYKAEPEILKTYDLFKMLYHMEDKYKGFKDRFWDFIIDNYDIRNDSFFRLNFYYFGDKKQQDKYIAEGEDVEQIEDLRLFTEEYGYLLEKDGQESIWLWISW